MATWLGNLISVCVGASIGASMRWGLSYWLNERLPDFPLGTLLCNLIGGLAVGVALAVFLAQEWPEHVRLFVITGLLGGLTTFSTFSSEVSMLLLRQEYALGFVLAATHLFGSLVLTIIGFMGVRWLMQ
jgi:Integral membrane protein possibly involved in chromosome condensation